MNSLSTHKTDDVRENIIATGQLIMAGKGYSAVGLNEILTAAGVPKGSFYHYFSSKDAFGVAMLESYFEAYHAEIDRTVALPGQTMAQRLMKYWELWQTSQSFHNCEGKCLAVKLGAEVADLSEPMRQVLDRGINGIVARLTAAIVSGVAEGSVATKDDPATTARSLYQLWMGASLMVKIARNTEPFETALSATRKILQPAP
jgi:TetR/AcrR family transcriptional regulator, transcriptional repressor for nem operon